MNNNTIQTFTSADHKVTINTSEATPDDVVTLMLPSKLACESALVQVPQMYLLSYSSLIDHPRSKFKCFSHLVHG